MIRTKANPLTVKQALDELVTRDLYHPLNKLARACRSNIEEVVSDERSRYVTRARRACMAYLMNEEGLSSVVIGWLLRKDHSTVLYGVKKARESAKAQQADVRGSGPQRPT